MGTPDKVAIARILKVNHAGEYGAIRIYRAQIWVARRLYPEIVGFLKQTLDHEIEHCALFRNAMPARGARPCRVLGLWGNGGLVLGFLTALMGRQGVWICTEAVEATVHRHLDQQLYFLERRDPELHRLIGSIQQEELSHLDYAREHVTSRPLWKRVLRAFVAAATEAVICLSTWGDSCRMAKDLTAVRAGQLPRDPTSGEAEKHTFAPGNTDHVRLGDYSRVSTQIPRGSRYERTRG
jgi:ubiquinone biosynthesis monooxygenase Coq7